ncbi:MAG TPA: PilC/PilY family type IV pilus protein [Noviherbaspirillum sp.]
MNILKKLQLSMLALLAGLAASPMPAAAEDIDIFIGASGGTANNANVLIVLDNTTNWNRQSQHWPGQITQAQAEINAIKSVVSSLGSNVNVGLMMITAGGSGNRGGYIRSAIKPMTDANKTAFISLLTTMYNNYNDEGVASSMNYGNILFDAFKYFGGYTSPAHATDDVAGSPTGKTYFGETVFNDLTPTAKADATGYASGGYTTYSSPITSANSCSKSYIIFIGNGFPNDDSPTWLSNVGGSTASIAMPNYTTTVTTTTHNLGLTGSCYSNLSQCSTEGYAACTDGTYSSCSCSSSTTSTENCTPNKQKYTVQAVSTTTTATPTGTYSQPSKPRLADEWTRFLYQTDVSPVSGQQNVSTYTIDVYNAQQDADQTALLRNMAKVGGGKYFAATDENKIVNALKEIFAEIQAVNSTFASASLPVNATNRSQTENQVFIGMFRPDPDAKPRWFGNMKRYQLIESGGAIELGDVSGNLAVNPLTGFITSCAASYWTTDSGTYWQNIAINPSPAGSCTTTANSIYSDAPDGPQVEKGAVAEVLRKGNNPPGTNTTPTYAVNRTVYTVDNNALAAFDTTTSGLSSTLVDFVLGKDVNDEKGTGDLTTARPSVHGDVIHSRPLPVNYNGSGIVAYYGANDGTLRAVEAETGKEKWAFIAPEFFSRFARMKDNSPLVNYPNLSASTTPAPIPKDYFFDGSIGLYQNADNSKIWIFPTMRRGGRMVYALDVTNPATPVLKWRVGCPNLSDDVGCTTGMSGIGQTWSAPRVAFLKGYSTTTPVVVMGGGYDSCEDTDSATPTCSSPKGGVIYVLNADTGELLASFTTTRSVAADISFVDIDGDGYPDYAYAADTGGNLYRISFVDSPSSRTALAANAWTMRRVAYTNGAGRKFLFAPAVLANSGKVYLAIGSGDREHPLQTNYPYSSVTNRFYVYLDNLTTTSGNADDMDSTVTMADYSSGTTCETPYILPTSSLKGWFMDLNQNGQGEQTVTSALIAAGMVTFSTNRPIAPAAGTCSTTLGEARGYWLNLFNASGAIGVSGSCGGSRSSTFVGGGLPPSPVLTPGVSVGGRRVTVVIGAVQRKSVSGSNAPIAPQRVDPTITSKRKQIYTATQSDN